MPQGLTHDELKRLGQLMSQLKTLSDKDLDLVWQTCTLQILQRAGAEKGYQNAALTFLRNVKEGVCNPLKDRNN